MKKILDKYSNYITGALVIIIILLGAMVNNQRKLKDYLYNQKLNEYQRQVDSLNLEIQDTRRLRDSLVTVNDNLVRSNKGLTVLVREKDKEIKTIKGKYDRLTDSELEQKMIEVWNANR